MKTDAKSSGSNSATTSPSAPPNEPQASHAASHDASLTEAQFLQQEAARARAAIGEALSDLGRSLKATGDPHVLTRDHPWIAVSTAAVAGFAAALTLIPSKEQQALRTLAELEKARHAPPPPPPSTSDKHATGVFATIAAELLKTVRPLVTALLTAGITRAASAPAAEGNGHTAEDEIATPS